tara:strand:+ start:128 stop:331 length:204 start_codon:yes stop_codon:yes gene_type:complete
VKAGSLVHITRASIGVPAGTIGLITKVYGSDRIERHDTIMLYDIKLANGSGRIVRRIARDFEVISES